MKYVYNIHTGYTLVPEAFDHEFKNIRSKDSLLVQQERKIEDAKNAIEYNIRGLLNYYKQFEDINPMDNGKVEELESLAKHMIHALYSYREFK